MSNKQHPRFRFYYLCLIFMLFSTCKISTLYAADTGITDQDISEINWEEESTNSTQSTNLNEDPNGVVILFKMFGSLALVLSLLLFIAWLLRRFLPNNQMGTGRSDAIRIVSTKMLGNRRSLMLVRVRGQSLLLGVTPQSITTLTTIDEIEGEWAQSADTPKETPADKDAFQQHLGKFVNETLAADHDEHSTEDL